MTSGRPGKGAEIIGIEGPWKEKSEIVEGLRRRSPGAALALYERFGERVNRLVWRLLGADQEHDDVVQQVFLNVISSIGSLKDQGALDAWVARVTVNTARKEIRARKYRRILHLVPDTPDMPDESFGPEKGAFLRSFYSMVGRMRTSDRIAFTLRFIEGMKTGEIAAMTGISHATVRRHLSRAKRFFMKNARKDIFMASAIEEIENEG